MALFFWQHRLCIGTSLCWAGECSPMFRPAAKPGKTMKNWSEWWNRCWRSAKDIILYIISYFAAGGTGYFIVSCRLGITSLSMEARMTICMVSKWCLVVGLIAPGWNYFFEYLKGREFSPKGEDWDKAVARWKTLYSDADARFDEAFKPLMPSI